jgi:predicted aspartyl protease
MVWPMRLFITALAVFIYLGAADRPVRAQQNFAATQAILSNGLHLFVPVSINGTKRIWWMVDTGAPRSLIAPSFQQRLSLPLVTTGTKVKAMTNVGGQHYPVVLAKSVDVNGAELGPGYLAVTPINNILAERSNVFPAGFEKGGLIGMNFLLKHGAFINYKTFQIFLSPQGSNLPLSREGYEKMGYSYIPLHITPRKYVEVEGTIGDSSYSFLLDTGAFVTQLEPKIRERYRLSYIYTPYAMTAPYAGIKNVRLTQAKVPGFKIGNQDLSDYRVGFAESHSFDPGFRHEYGGILGPDLLYYHEALIDLGNRALYLKPDKRSHKH